MDFDSGDMMGVAQAPAELPAVEEFDPFAGGAAEPPQTPDELEQPEHAEEPQAEPEVAETAGPAEPAEPAEPVEPEPEPEPEEKDLMKVNSDALMANELTTAKADTTIYDANMVKLEEFKQRQDIEQATAKDMLENDAADQRRVFLDTYKINAEKRKADQEEARQEVVKCLQDSEKTSWKKVRTLMRDPTTTNADDIADRQASVIKHKVTHEDEEADAAKK